MSGWTLLVHGGAGAMRAGILPADEDARARAGLAAALDAGAGLLAAGGHALDAVEAAVRALEDDATFNAGRGAVLTWDGACDLDAAIMDGSTRAAGAVSGVRGPRHPVGLARAVMGDGRHVLLSGEGADAFGRERGIEQAPPGWFETPERRRQLEEIRAGGGFDSAMKYGTVGAVARDAAGRLAAATSTGGLTAKRWGRIGDSPLIGAGTYADGHVAVSCTGHGEAFIRAGAARAIALRIELLGQPPADAMRAVLADVGALGGVGGIIAVPATGAGVRAFTTPGMYRGEATADGRRIAIYDEED